MADKVMGVAQDAPLPTWSTTGTFKDWFGATNPQRLRSEKKVVYFHGCATMYYEPFIGMAAVLVMEHQGYEVIVPYQNCCGLPLLSNGEFKAARGYHKNNVAYMGSYAHAGFPIIGTSTSCTLTLKEEAPELLDMDDENTTELKLATWDIFEWLRELAVKGELATDFQPLNLKIPYHAPCQLRAHRVGKPALEIMEMIPGLDTAESHARCCGIAGTYGYKTEKYQIAMDVGEELFRFATGQMVSRKLGGEDVGARGVIDGVELERRAPNLQEFPKGKSTDRHGGVPQREPIADARTALTQDRPEGPVRSRPGCSSGYAPPGSSARRASQRAPVRIISFARPSPTMRGRRWVPPAAGMMPFAVVKNLSKPTRPVVAAVLASTSVPAS